MRSMLGELLFRLAGTDYLGNQFSRTLPIGSSSKHELNVRPEAHEARLRASHSVPCA